MSPRRPSASERVQVVLCALPWLAARGPTPLAVLAEHFDTSPDTLREDLNTVFYDVEPETTRMVDVEISDDDEEWVTATLLPFFAETPRLDTGEAMRLLVAGTALLGEPGADVALRPAVDKLAEALGPRAGAAMAVDLGRGSPELRATVRSCVADRRALAISYFAWSTDEVTERTVEPWALRSVEGNWYMTGYCRLSGGPRHFRLDRILAAEPVGDSGAFEPPTEVPDVATDIGTGGRRVRIEVPVEQAWKLQSYPHEEWRDAGDRVTVVLRIHSDAWMERLLVRLGPRAVAVDLDTGEDLSGVRRAAASRMLARYEAAS